MIHLASAEGEEKKGFMKVSSLEGKKILAKSTFECEITVKDDEKLLFA